MSNNELDRLEKRLEQVRREFKKALAEWGKDLTPFPKK